MVTSYDTFFQVARNSAAHVTFGELDQEDGTTQLVDLVFVLQAQNEQLFERLTALETVVSSATNNVKGLETYTL